MAHDKDMQLETLQLHAQAAILALTRLHLELIAAGRKAEADEVGIMALRVQEIGRKEVGNAD